jgi:Protein of unknown function (DUF3485)
MNPKQWKALGVVLTLLALTAASLMHIAAGQRLGQPGVKVVAEPTYMEGGQVVHTQSVSLPVELPDFASEPVEVTSLEVNWLPKDTLFGRRVYHNKDGFTNLLSVVLMGTDRTSIHKPQFCLDGQGWHIEKTETVTIPIPRPHPYELRAMKLTASKPALDSNGQPAQARGIYIYWFVADNQLTPYHGERMWWMARDLIWTGVLQRWAYVAYFTVCWPGQEELYFNRMKELVAASVPEFQLAAGPPLPPGSTVAAFQNGSKTKD